MRHVLDASAVIAMLLDEPGGDQVVELLDTACIGSVNLAEVATVLARRGGAPDEVRAVIEHAALVVIPTDLGVALDAGALWPDTRAFGASLGDRCALALSRRLDAILVTSDRALAEAAPIAADVTALMLR